ncbi:MAG: hypothetical protein J6C44_07660 [Muribaculaceae bacterium]|nr:hypothetical protein [Muribaculaceae bacterium]
MNNKITNIQQARELLDLWYQGNTTPEQEDLLYDFFTSSNNIPEDLRAEALIFGHTSDTPVPQAPTIDPSLLAEIDTAIDTEKKASAKALSPNRFKRLAWLSSSIAVAATIALLIIFNIPTAPDSTLAVTTEHPAIASNSPHHSNTNLPSEPNNSKSAADTISANTIPANTNINVAQSHTSKTTIHQSDPTPITDDGYEIIDSPEQAQAILQQSFALLKQSFDRSSNSIKTSTETINNSIDKISQITNSI